MPTAILMPALSPTMTEGTLAKWLKTEGEKIFPGDIIAEVETDKATMEVESIDEGILAKKIVNDGTENIPVNSLIAVILGIDEKEDVLPEFVNKHSNAKLPDQVESKENIIESIADSEDKNNIKPQDVKPEISNIGNQKKDTSNSNIQKAFELKAKTKKSSPLARRICEQAGIDINEIEGSGPHGRVIREDVENFLDSKKHTNLNIQKVKVDSSIKQPITSMRKIIAEKLTQSKQSIPHFYLISEISVDALISARREINDAILNTNDNNQIIKISLNDLIIKALSLALKTVPAANCSWTKDSLIVHGNVDISVAVAVDGGLFTPVIFNAAEIGLTEISQRMKVFIDKAKSGKLLPEEYKGGTFSISNLGMYEVDSFSAIINPPQSGILAIGKASDKVIVKNGDMSISKMMTCTLSLDHRVIDGALGAKLLSAFKNFIERPSTMLL